MNATHVMQSLKSMGTAQNVKIYKRHGAGDNLFGVSFANLNQLKKQIKVDHDLAMALWQTGNTDARSLAIMIADPDRLTAAEADDWLDDVSYDLLAGMLGGLVARSKLALRKFKKWSKSKKEYVRSCGYAVLCAMLRDDPDQVPVEVCKESLADIQRQLAGSPNYARHSMNSALISIGIYKPSLTDEAIETARRIGKVEVDHGETSCKTPDAEPYIRKALDRKRPKRRAKAKARC